MTATEFFKIFIAMGVLGLLWLALVILVAISTPEPPEETWKRHKWWQRM